MSYAVKEVFLTIQGEGAMAGRVAVFCRFAGCNLWSGREDDRAGSCSAWCDTDFVGGTRYASAAELADAIAGKWPAGQPGQFVVFTGGEPALQLDDALVDILSRRGFLVGVETNGTRALPAGVAWVCVSPKAGHELRLARWDELKLVYPQPGVDPASFAHGRGGLSLQPCDGPNLQANTEAAIAYCLTHPRWRLSVQIHKTIGVR